jgi:hypothetical protein
MYYALVTTHVEWKKKKVTRCVDEQFHIPFLLHVIERAKLTSYILRYQVPLNALSS